MIYDKLSMIEVYRGLYKNLDIAIDYLVTNDITVLPNGKTQINGDDVYINRVNVNLIDESDGIYEFHRKYLDIHVGIIGEERVLVSDIDKSKMVKEYSVEDDYGLVKGSRLNECVVDSKHFMICMLNEPHMPCVLSNDEKIITKIIVKVLAE